MGFVLLDLQLQNTTQKTEDRATQTALKTNNDLQNTTQKTEDRETQAPQFSVWCFVDRCFFLMGLCVARSSVFRVVFCRSLFLFSGVCVARSSVFCVVFCRSLQKTEDRATQTSLKQTDQQSTTQKTEDRETQNPLKQTTIYKTLHRKPKIEQHKTH
jgi:hypothetical protein